MKNLKQLRKDRQRTQKQMADYLGISQQGYAAYENGVNQASYDILQKLSAYFNVSIDYLLGQTDTPSPLPDNLDPVSGDETYTFPVIGAICCGFDGNSEFSPTGDDIVIPKYLLKTHNPEDYFVLEVKGNSMYPLYLPGDKVLIRKTNSVDSGTIAAVGYDCEEATLKKVEYVYGEDWLKLIPRNPEYPTKIIRGADLELCRVYGEVVYLFRDKVGF